MGNPKYIFTSFILITLLFFIFRSLGILEFEGIRQNRKCKKEEKVLSYSIEGVVIDKFRDSNSHNHKTLVLQQRNNEIKRTTFLVLDLSGAFDKIEVGARIEKKSGDLILLVLGDSSNYKIELDYNCNKEE